MLHDLYIDVFHYVYDLCNIDLKTLVTGLRKFMEGLTNDMERSNEMVGSLCFH